MGGEGSMMAANNSLKNNRNLLSKRKEKQALSGSYSNYKVKEFPAATSEQLEQIREQIQKDNRKSKKKQIVTFIVIILIIVLLFYIYVF